MYRIMIGFNTHMDCSKRFLFFDDDRLMYHRMVSTCRHLQTLNGKFNPSKTLQSLFIPCYTELVTSDLSGSHDTNTSHVSITKHMYSWWEINSTSQNDETFKTHNLNSNMTT